MLKIAALSLFLAVGGVAAADIRIDDDPVSQPTPTSAPRTPPVADNKGCSARGATSPEWMFGLIVLAAGAWGLRRFAPRRVIES